MNGLLALACGTLFGFGLAFSGMTDVSRVLGFLDITGQWDPTLVFVMGGGILISLPFFQFGLGRLSKPVFADIFRVPGPGEIDLRLISGAACFGIGWGLVGLCPGPAIASLVYLNPDIVYFVIAMLLGMLAVDGMDRLRQAPAEQA